MWGAIMVLGAVNFLAGLGSSSLYIDEGLSWAAASAPLGDVIHRVAEGEITPPLHYYGLHEVIGRVSDSEVALRLPSALAGIATVAATIWVGTRAAGAAAGRLAGGLAAVSPLLLQYSQQARAYVFAMLAVTVAAGALLEAERLDRGSRKRAAWLVVVSAASVVGFWTHYTAALVVVPLLMGAVLRGGVSRREMAAVSAVTAIAWSGSVPLVLDQLDNGNEEGVGVLARLTVANAVEALGTPFDSTYGDYDLTVLAAVGAIVMLVGGAVIAGGRFRPSWVKPVMNEQAMRLMVLPAAFVPVLALLIVTVAGPDVLVTRYLAVAAPFMLVLIAGAVAALPRRWGTGIAVVAALCAVGGSLAGHTVHGRYLDWRGATAEIDARARPGDAAVLGYPPSGAVFDYYKVQAGLTWLPTVPSSDPAVRSLLEHKRRLWLINEPAVPPATIRADLRSFGYRSGFIREFPGNEALGLTLAVPSRGGGD